MQSKECRTGKTIFARLDAGDDLLLSLTKLAEEHEIRAGSFTMIGGLKKLVYGLYEDRKYRNVEMSAKHCLEMLATAGSVSIKDGKVLIHCHICAADEEEGVARGGHLMEGSIIYPFAEVFMQEIDAELVREHDPKTNLFPIKI